MGRWVGGLIDSFIPIRHVIIVSTHPPTHPPTHSSYVPACLRRSRAKPAPAHPPTGALGGVRGVICPERREGYEGKETVAGEGRQGRDPIHFLFLFLDVFFVGVVGGEGREEGGGGRTQ